MPHCCICFRRLAAGAICPVDGTRMAATNVQAIVGEPPPGYQETSVLGVGGYATTWHVQAAGKSNLALKWGRRATAAAIARFEQEAAIMSEVGSSVAPKLVESGLLEGRPFLLMEELEGEHLAAVLERLDKGMPASRTIEIATSIATAIQALHRMGIVHRDLKPDNVFVQEHGTRLIDYGVSGRVGAASGGSGTPQYAAPEQWRDTPVGTAADVYGWGVMVYELVCLRLPFVGEGKAIQYEHATLRPPRPSEFAELPQALEDLILSALSKSPGDRPDVAELLERLKSANSDTPIVVSTESSEVVTSVPTLVLALEIRLGAAKLAEMAQRFQAEIVEHRTSEIRLAWRSDAHENPLGVARECAQFAIALGAKSPTIHVVRAQVVLHQGVERLFGKELEDTPWWARQGNADVVLTPAAMQIQACAISQVALIGRNDELQTILDEALMAFGAQRARMTCVSAVSGLGATRLLREAQRAIANEVEVEVHCVCIDESTFGQDEAESILDLCLSGPVLLVVDRLQDCSSEVLDLLEYVLLPGADKSLFLLASASEDFKKSRPGWGRRCQGYREIELTPLDTTRTSELLAELLSPAQYISHSVLDELSEWCGGVPKAAYDLASRLVRDGFIVQRGLGAYRLDTERLAALPTLPLDQWVASQALAALGKEVTAFGLLCAVLPADFSEETTTRMSKSVSFSQGVADSSVALFLLVGQGVLQEEHGLYRFRNLGVRSALAARLSPAQVAEIHSLAVVVWQERERDYEALHALSFHASGAGQPILAATTKIELADWQRECHRAVEAYRYYSESLVLLEQVPGEERLLLRALGGLAWAGYRVDRVSDSITRAEEAIALASTMGLRKEQVLAMLELATALDWAQRPKESADRVREAQVLADQYGLCGDVLLSLRLDFGQGRSAWREGDIEAALVHLRDAAEAAAAAGDFDTQVVALLLLAPALVSLGYDKLAEARFDELFALCIPASDKFHLCAAYGNRMFLWSARKDPDRARDDLRSAKRLAEQIGHPSPERVAVYNLAEDLYWSGEDDEEALELARRSRYLAAQFIDLPVAEDALLVARTSLALGDWESAREALSWVQGIDAAERCRPSELFMEMVGLCLTADTARDAAWNELLTSAAAELSGDDLLEFCYWRVRSGPPSTEELTRIVRACAPLLVEYPIWNERFEGLEAFSGQCFGAPSE
ncbi:MAG: serine/threonine protein kinase [Kofleriaceae bacterium]|nr:serine/threonine protein kinase [Kofleriaceae bacterium]